MSRFVAQLLERLFPDAAVGATVARKSVPYLTEGLYRSASFLTAFESWRATEWPEIASLLHEDALKALQTGTAQRISVHHFNGSGGALFDVSLLPEQTASFMLEAFMVRIKEHGYRLQQADRQYFDKTSTVERKDRYYLKPPYAETIPMDQGYGNILIELIVDDRTPRVIKLQANTYHDVQYLPARPFNELLFRMLAKG